MSGALALLPLREADAARCGPKAASLAALEKQGLAVPAGLCLPFASYRAAGAAAAARARAELTVDAQSLAAVVAALGDRVVVRSSASCEDAEGFSAAGIFESVLGVELGAEGGGARLGHAITTVWASLGSPAARALLADAGRSVQDEAMAVLIQRQLDARLGGHALLHADGYLEIEAVRGHPSALASGSADPERLGLARDEEPAARWRALVELLRRAALEGAACELEWLVDGRGVPWLLQRRPLRSAPDERDRPHVELDEADAARSLGRRWIWDREHNPDPLSPAHASLMQELASAERTRVVDGYLYYADDTVPPSGEGGAAMGDGAAAAAALGQAELWLAALVARGRARIGCEHDVCARLAAARRFFAEFAARYEQTLGAARRALMAAAQAQLGEAAADRFFAPEHQGHARARALAHAARCEDPHERAARLALYRARYGRLAAVWDIAEPTLAERPTYLAREQPLAASAAAGDNSAASAAGDGEATAWLALARRSREDDDLLFCEALWLLREALLRGGEVLVARGALRRTADVFALPLARVASALAAPQPPALQVEAARGHARWRAARARRPPLVIEPDGALRFEPLAGVAEPLRGLGVGTRRVQGRAYVLRGALLDAPDVDGRVLVCRTLLPGAAPLLSRAAALVSEAGGSLSHAACLARELGVPAVVGVGAGLWAIRQGERVEVDAGAGKVVRLVHRTEDGDNVRSAAGYLQREDPD